LIAAASRSVSGTGSAEPIGSSVRNAPFDVSLRLDRLALDEGGCVGPSSEHRVSSTQMRSATVGSLPTTAAEISAPRKEGCPQPSSVDTGGERPPGDRSPLERAPDRARPQKCVCGVKRTRWTLARTHLVRRLPGPSSCSRVSKHKEAKVQMICIAIDLKLRWQRSARLWRCGYDRSPR